MKTCQNIFKKIVISFTFASLLPFVILAEMPPQTPDINETNESFASIVYRVKDTNRTNLYSITKDNNWSIGRDKNATLPFNNFENAYELNSTNVNGWENALASASFFLKSKQKYQIVLKIKSDTYPGQNIVIKADGPRKDSDIEYAWNVSKSNEFEEVIFSVYPLVDGNWSVKLWTYDKTKYAESNSTIFVSSSLEVFKLQDAQELIATYDIDILKDKRAFQSQTHKVDGLGNFYIKEDDNETWRHIFPKMIYRGASQEYLELFTRYRDYGFNGIMDIWTAKQAQIALDAGLSYISIHSNSSGYSFEEMARYINDVYNWSETNNTHKNIIWYNFDNENGFIADYDYQKQLAKLIDANHTDPKTFTRRYPIYYLNGQVGLARSYNNDDRRVMDITGSYVASSATGGVSKNITPTILTQFLTKNQKSPSTVIQLQHDLNQTFIPALFYGLIQGGKALSIWRDEASDGNGSRIDFRTQFWADAFRDEISPRLDLMLEIIEKPHFTNWSASSDKFPDVRVGTRELDDIGFLIVSNFAPNDNLVKITLEDFNASKAVDFFTRETISDINGSSFFFTIEHNNSGYKVIELQR